MRSFRTNDAARPPQNGGWPFPPGFRQTPISLDPADPFSKEKHDGPIRPTDVTDDRSGTAEAAPGRWQTSGIILEILEDRMAGLQAGASRRHAVAWLETEILTPRRPVAPSRH
jgi:hypothetical protein